MEIFKWITGNYQEILLAVGAVLGAAEVIVRITPTKKDDGAVERIGGLIKKVLDFFKVPNIKK